MSKNSSKGILSGLKNKVKEEKNETSQKDKNLDSKMETLSVKRSFSLRPSTVRKLQLLKTMYENINITYNEIVDEAINELYMKKKDELTKGI